MIHLECMGGPYDGQIVKTEPDVGIVYFPIKTNDDSLFDDRNLFKNTYKRIRYEKRLNKLDGKYYLIYIRD